MSDQNKEQVFAYRAVCEHGKVRAMAVDRPEYAKDTAKDVGQWLRWGLHIERVTIEEARKSDLTCNSCDEIHRAKKKRKKPEEAPLFEATR